MEKKAYLCVRFMMVRTKKKILSVVLVGLYLSFYASTHFFYHTHQYTWGTVTHSHPYTQGTHTHSAHALQLINNLTNMLFTGGVSAVCSMVLWVSTILFSSTETGHAPSLLIGSNQLRAPPVQA